MTPSHSPPDVSLRSLLGLAWPIVLARATQSVIGFTDALLVSPLGEEALAAVTTGSLNTIAAVIFPMGTLFILQSFAAQLRGRGDLESVRRYAVYGLVLSMASGVLAAAFVPFLPSVLGRFGYAPRVLELMTTYLSIRLLSVGAAAGTEALGNWYGGLGNTRLAMIAGVVAMTANVIGAYALIEPRFGLPGYGVAGAAWASVGASWLGFAVVFVAFVRRWGYELPKGPLRPRASELVRVLRFGVPNGVNWFLEFSAFALFINVVVGHLGTTVLAAFNVVMQINSLSFMPAFGVASAGAILVGENIGAKRQDRVWPIVRLAAAIAAIWMTSIGLVYLAFPARIIGLFAPEGHALLAVGGTMLAMSALWQTFDALALTVSETLRAAGDTAWCMAARIVLAWVVFTPAAWALVFVWGGGVTTVMVSLVCYLGLLAGVFCWRFATGRWKNIDLIGEPQVV